MSSVDKALQILVLLGDNKGLRVIDVADRLGIAQSSAHRLLTALAYRDFVAQDSRKVYQRGPAFDQAGLATHRLAAMRVAMWPHLESLAARTGETCHLTVLEGNSARFTDGIESPEVVRVRSRAGMLLPAHTTAAGKILLADRTPTELSALYPFGLPGSKPGDNDLVRRRELRQDLEECRRRGYATNIGQTERGVVAVAVALRDSAGRAHASIAVACPAIRCRRGRVEWLAAELRETVTEAMPALERCLDPGPSSLATFRTLHLSASRTMSLRCAAVRFFHTRRPSVLGAEGR